MKNLLLFRLAIFNTCAAALVVWAWMQGYVQRVTEADAAHMSYILGALFAAGLVSTFWRAHKTGKALDALKEKVRYLVGEKSLMARQARKMEIKNEHIGDVISALFILGIIGNAIGCIRAFGQINDAALSSTEGMRSMGAGLLAGAGTSFGATLIGCSLALWTLANYRMLATATALYIEDVS